MAGSGPDKAPRRTRVSKGSASDTHSLRVLAAVMKTKGVGILTYQADRDNLRRDAGDCHEGARTAGAAHPPASDERTCRDDQE